MQASVKKWLDDYLALNKYSRILLHIGFWLCYSCLMVCWALYACAGRYGEYWTLHTLAQELSAFVRSAIGLIGIAAITTSFLPTSG